MIHVYFQDRLESRDLQAIYDWGGEHYGGVASIDGFRNNHIIGVLLPDWSAVTLFKLSFPYSARDCFETMSTFTV